MTENTPGTGPGHYWTPTGEAVTSPAGDMHPILGHRAPDGALSVLAWSEEGGSYVGLEDVGAAWLVLLAAPDGAGVEPRERQAWVRENLYAHQWELINGCWVMKALSPALPSGPADAAVVIGDHCELHGIASFSWSEEQSAPCRDMEKEHLWLEAMSARTGALIPAIDLDRAPVDLLGPDGPAHVTEAVTPSAQSPADPEPMEVEADPQPEAMAPAIPPTDLMEGPPDGFLGESGATELEYDEPPPGMDDDYVPVEHDHPPVEPDIEDRPSPRRGGGRHSRRNPDQGRRERLSGDLNRMAEQSSKEDRDAAQTQLFGLSGDAVTGGFRVIEGDPLGITWDNWTAYGDAGVRWAIRHASLACLELKGKISPEAQIWVGLHIKGFNQIRTERLRAVLGEIPVEMRDRFYGLVSPTDRQIWVLEGVDGQVHCVMENGRPIYNDKILNFVRGYLGSRGASEPIRGPLI